MSETIGSDYKLLKDNFWQQQLGLILLFTGTSEEQLVQSYGWHDRVRRTDVMHKDPKYLTRNINLSRQVSNLKSFRLCTEVITSYEKILINNMYHFLEQVGQNVVQSFRSDGIMKLIKCFGSSHTNFRQRVDQSTTHRGYQGIYILYYL